MPTNELVYEKSPYLRQHADNPVQWMPWGEAAFAKARQEDKPIFLSIGYSTCHWCHVMAHESFEDEATAAVLNEHFVAIKLDREERPDVDRIYMLFVQATTGSGGWPMSVWLTPDLKPFFGGTYFPPNTRYGRPGFRDLLSHLARAWREDRAKIDESSISVTQHLQGLERTPSGTGELSLELFGLAFPQLVRSFDERHGGFGGAPKFPRPVSLNYLLRYHALTKSEEALEMVTKTLHSMADGGMHDQLGGGFHRYSVDEYWFVPHFEKMLYDQAQLAATYLEAFQVTGDESFASVVRDILNYVRRDMTDERGGFYSAEDADSADPENPGHHGEGAFYIWSKKEIDSLLGPTSEVICRFYGVQAEGNVEQDPHAEFRGRNILYRAEGRSQPSEDTLATAQGILFDARERRARPHLDNKVLTAWNGLMISAFARAAGVLGSSEYLEAAERAARFIIETMYDRGTGRLLRRYCEGEAAISGFADDYAFLAQGLVDLFEGTGKAEYLVIAVELMTRGLSKFEDPEGGYFSTPQEAPDVLVRLKDDYDGAEPSANSVAADVLLRLGHLTGDESLVQRGEQTLRAFGPKLRAQPTIAPQMAVALSRWLSSPEQVILRCPAVDDEVVDELRERRRTFAPYTSVIALSDASAADVKSIAPFLGSLERRGLWDLYECRNLVCALPRILR